MESAHVSDGYGKLFDSYWTGHTGRAIQAMGASAVILGLYLPSTRHANMIGLYSLPLLYVVHDLPVLGGLDGVRAAFAGLADVGYAFYDDAAEIVWVVEMARVRCGLRRQEPLAVRDKRHAAILRLYHDTRPTPLLDRFYARYSEQLGLGLRNPFGGPPKPLRRPSEASQQSAVSSQQSTEERKNARGKRALFVPTGRDHLKANGRGSSGVRVLAGLVVRERLDRQHADEGDLIEAVKQRAARLQVAYTSAIVRKAIASARAQLRKAQA